jgi:hypothetical protein
MPSIVSGANTDMIVRVQLCPAFMELEDSILYSKN